MNGLIKDITKNIIANDESLKGMEIVFNKITFSDTYVNAYFFIDGKSFIFLIDPDTNEICDWFNN